MSQHNTFLLQTAPQSHPILFVHLQRVNNSEQGNGYCHFSELVDLDQNVVMSTVRGDVIDPGVEDDPGHGQSDGACVLCCPGHTGDW